MHCGSTFKLWVCLCLSFCLSLFLSVMILSSSSQSGARVVGVSVPDKSQLLVFTQKRREDSAHMEMVSFCDNPPHRKTTHNQDEPQVNEVKDIKVFCTVPEICI